MADTKRVMYKLQTALKQKGVIVVINQSQFYSKEDDRFVTVYTAKRGTKVLEKSASQIKIINAMKEVLEEIRESEAVKDD